MCILAQFQGKKGLCIVQHLLWSSFPPHPESDSSIRTACDHDVKGLGLCGYSDEFDEYLS